MTPPSDLHDLPQESVIESETEEVQSLAELAETVEDAVDTADGAAGGIPVEIKPNESLPPDALIIEPDFQSHCHICEWSLDHIELYNWISDKALKGLPSTKLINILRPYMEEHYPDVVVPSRKSVWNHFKSHIRPKDLVDIVVAKGDYKIDMNESLVGEFVAQEIRKGNFDEYKELCALYIRFREVHNKIYALTAALMEPKGKGANKWSQRKITTYVTMVNAQRAILTEIGKMRQGDKLIDIVAKFVMETYTKSIVSRLSEEFKALATIMQKHNVDHGIIEAYNEITHAKLAQIIVDEAEKAMGQAKKEFKLPIN